ncbi:MAG TPA: anti-sigma factor antagonist [Caldithrix abyssi]|uniref:Anti-sigma factor antagonist n=1 Tax=Caldithrix abyssi TaxID=187145 RepID=A0A7V5RPD9_CALAY|nr:anti-sigma factor antagonist [Caldithrix abyssi]
MTIDVKEQDGVVIIALSGKIMGGPEAGQLNDQINRLIDEHKTRIVIDLGGVEWMNSSGLGILIGTVTTLKNNDGQLVLTHVSERIYNLLKITKLLSVFTLAENLDDALQKF